MLEKQSKIGESNIPDVPETIQNLDFIAGGLFTCSFLISKIRDLPIGPASLILSGFTLYLYGMAYTIQLFTSCYYHDIKPKESWEWSYREYYMAVCVLGATVCWLSLCIPALWFPLMWIGTFNTIFWYVGETHRLEEHTAYPKMASTPELYLNYVKCIAISSVISSTAISIAFLFPAHFMLIYMLGVLGNYIASTAAIYNLTHSDDTPPLNLSSNL
jgi:hypothetical protein